MESIREIFRIGVGPSSSHTMAPKRAAERFRAKHPQTENFRVTLFESLAATGKGHLTDVAIKKAFDPLPIEIIWKPDHQLPMHPNGMLFEALNRKDQVTDSWKVYSVGGGALGEEGEKSAVKSVYNLSSLTDVMDMCENSSLSYWEYVQRCEDDGIWDFLTDIWDTMKKAIERGLTTEGILPGGLGLPRKAFQIHKKVLTKSAEFKQTGLLSAYAMAVAEENASGGIIVAAPTCGAAGIIPSVIKYVQEIILRSDKMILHGLATAGLIGTVIKTNGSISGAQVGCQGEVGSACAMAAGAAAQMLGGSLRQIEYAAEMGLEHHLGLTCDPVNGLVQIPCIERNAHAASRALSCAQLSLLSDGAHRIPFDDAVTVMKQTGIDLPSLYRETARGGLATVFKQRNRKPNKMRP